MTWNAQQNNNEWKRTELLRRKRCVFFSFSYYRYHRASHYGVNSCVGCDFGPKAIVRNSGARDLDSLTFYPRAFYLPLFPDLTGTTENRGRTRGGVKKAENLISQADRPPTSRGFREYRDVNQELAGQAGVFGMILISSVRQLGMKPRTLLGTIIFRISRASIKQHRSRFGISMSLSPIK